MAGHPAAALQRTAHHRIAGGLGNVERRAERLAGFRVEPFIVDAVQPVGVDMALGNLNVMDIVLPAS